MRDTIDMMRDACDKDKVDAWQNGFWTITQEELKAFEALVRADERSVEREACANDKLNAERYRHMRNNAQFQSRNGPGLYWYLPRFMDGKVRDEGKQLDDAIDAAIRARGETK